MRPLPRRGSPAWRPRRTGRGIRDRRDFLPLIKAQGAPATYQGSDLGGTAGFEVHVPQLRRLILTPRQHAHAIRD